jgi:hypothetical protein
MEKSIELFAKNGIEATSVQHITETCGISKGAFYLSFKSKDELILAIIDFFMKEIVSETDQIVSSDLANEEKLFQFYLYSLSMFEKHRDFAKMYIQEQLHTFNEELFQTLSGYDELVNQSILTLIDKIYGEQAFKIRYDLLLCIKGFVNAYTQLILHQRFPHNLERIARVLVDKTNCLGYYSKEVYTTKEMLEFGSELEFSLQSILEEIGELEKDSPDELHRESFLLLKEELLSSNPRQAIVKGLMGNLEDEDSFQWLLFMLKKYYKW